MKKMRTLASMLLISGLSAGSVWGQTGGEPVYPNTSSYASPSLLPLPTVGSEATMPLPAVQPAGFRAPYYPNTSVPTPAPVQQPQYRAAPGYGPNYNRMADRSGGPTVAKPEQSIKSRVIGGGEESHGAELSAPADRHIRSGRSGRVHAEESIQSGPSMGGPIQGGEYSGEHYGAAGGSAGYTGQGVYGSAGGEYAGGGPVSSCIGGGGYAGGAGYENSAYAESGYAGGCGGESWAGGYNGGWFAHGAALGMTINQSNQFWSTYETGNNPNQLLNSNDSEVGWGGGFEVAFGKVDICSCRGWEVKYWGLYGLEGSASIFSAADNLSTPLDLGGVTIGGALATDFFDNAREHRLYKSNEVHSIELNFLHLNFASACGGMGGGGYVGGYGGPVRRGFEMTMLAGARYFQFNEDFRFSSVAGGSAFGANGGLDEAHLAINTDNHMIGGQVGGRGDCYFGQSSSFFFAPKVGMYVNHVENQARLYRGDGATTFDVGATKDDIAVMAELDLGLEHCFSNNWRIFGGYRVLAISGVALADNQIPHYLADTPGFTEIDTSSSVLIHGAFGGLEYRW